MALIRFDTFDPFSNLLSLQQELERFARNPAFNLGPSGVLIRQSMYLKTMTAQ